MRFRRMMVFVVAFWMVAMLLPASASAQFRLLVVDQTAGHADADGNYQGVVVTDVGTGYIFASLDIVDPLHPESSTSSVTIGEARGTVALDTGQLAKLSMNEITVTSTGPATLRLILEDTGYTDNGNLVSNHVYDGHWQALWGAPTPDGSSVQISSWANASNEVPDLGADHATPSAIGSLPSYSGVSSTRTFYSSDGPDFGSAIDDHLADTSAEFHTTSSLGYSLWSEVLITFAGAGSLSFYHDTFTTYDAALTGTPTPEPASLMLIGTGVVALASRMRRRKLTRV